MIQNKRETTKESMAETQIIPKLLNSEMKVYHTWHNTAHNLLS